MKTLTLRVWIGERTHFSLSSKVIVLIHSATQAPTRHFDRLQHTQHGSWIYNQCLSQLMLWVWISIRARCTTLCDKVCQWLVTGRWFSPGPPVSSTNKTDRHDITEILLKVALNTIKQTNKNNILGSFTTSSKPEWCSTSWWGNVF
jgi:hypothetical protein